MPARVHLRLRFQNLGKPRTAGLCEQAARMSDCGPLSCYIFERPSPLEKPSCKVRLFANRHSANIAKKLPPRRCPQPFLIPIFNFPHKRLTFAFAGESGYTLGFAQRIEHKRSHGETRGVSDGGAITTLGAFRTFTNIPGRVSERRTLPLFGPWPGALRRTQRAFGTAMRLCASLLRGVAPPLGCVIRGEHL